MRDIIFQAPGRKKERDTGVGPCVYEPLWNHQMVMTAQAIISATRTGLLSLKPGKKVPDYEARTHTRKVQRVCVRVSGCSVHPAGFFRWSLHL